MPVPLAKKTTEHAGVAQSVEQLIRNEKVAGSIPVSGTIKQFHAVPSSAMNPSRSPSSAGFFFHVVPSSLIQALVF